MLKFQVIHEKEMTVAQFSASLSVDNLRDLTNEMIKTILDLISSAVDTDVTFEPVDPECYDSFATIPEEAHLAWTLGHVIVHTTASAEEAAAIAAELARGVAYHGRSRQEVPWGQIKTIKDCRERLEESRRMRLASLEMWPEHPHLEIECEAWPRGPVVNAVGRFVLGLMHDDSHLGQIEEIMRQARSARSK